MKDLPAIEPDNALLLRTDFSDDPAWEALCRAIREPGPGGDAGEFADCVSDPAYDGLTVEQLVALAARGGDLSFVLVADGATFAGPDRAVLVVDLLDEPGRTFRVVPGQVWSVVSNLSIANVDFDEFAENVDSGGVFRGFPGE